MLVGRKSSIPQLSQRFPGRVVAILVGVLDHELQQTDCFVCGRVALANRRHGLEVGGLLAPLNLVELVRNGHALHLWRPVDYRINLGCVHDVDVLALDIEVINGKAC